MECADPTEQRPCLQGRHLRNGPAGVSSMGQQPLRHHCAGAYGPTMNLLDRGLRPSTGAPPGPGLLGPLAWQERPEGCGRFSCPQRHLDGNNLLEDRSLSLSFLFSIPFLSTQYIMCNLFFNKSGLLHSSTLVQQSNCILTLNDHPLISHTSHDSKASYLRLR